MPAFKLTQAEAATLDSLIETYGLALKALTDQISKITEAWESAFHEKSNEWKASEAGQRAEERLDLLHAWLDCLSSAGPPKQGSWNEGRADYDF